MEKELLTIKEISEYLKIPVTTLRCWCSRKVIPYKKLGHLVRFSKEEIDRWVEEHSVKEEAIEIDFKKESLPISSFLGYNKTKWRKNGDF